MDNTARHEHLNKRDVEEMLLLLEILVGKGLPDWLKNRLHSCDCCRQIFVAIYDVIEVKVKEASKCGI
jgi:hypothetical protein